MTSFETAILILVILGLLLQARPGPMARRAGAICALLAIGATAWSLSTDALRWQMCPAVVLAFVPIFRLVTRELARRRARSSELTEPQHPMRRRGRLLRWSIRGALVLLALVSVALPALFPLRMLPPPTGSFAVGVTRFNVSDGQRQETLSSGETVNRQIEVIAWYPALTGSGTAAPIWGNPKAIGHALTGLLGLPPDMFDYLDRVPSHAFLDAQPAGEKRYPTLIFSHGYLSFAAQSSALLEDLASHGYIVLAINHPGDGLVTRRADGRVVGPDRARIALVRGELDKTRAALSIVNKTDSPTMAENTLRQAQLGAPTIRQIIGMWADDIDLLRNTVKQDGGPIASTPIARAVDSSRIAVMGMSLGGAAAMEVCSRSMDCPALIDLDGASFTLSAFSGVHAPALFMANGTPNTGRMNLTFFRKAPKGSEYVAVKGAAHFDFSDFPLVFPMLRWFGVAGPVGGEQATIMVRTRVRSFLDAHLRGPSVEANRELRVGS